MQTVQKDKLYAYAGLVMAVLFWAANTVLARGVITEINPLSLSFWRWFAALVFILPLGIRHIKKDIIEIRSNKFHLLLLSFLSVGIYNSLLYEAAHFTTAINMSIATAAGPAITIIVAWLIISERPSSLQIIGVVIAAAGMLSLIAKGSLINVYHLDINWGDLLVATAVIAWSFYSVFLRKFNIKIDPLSLLTVTIVLGTLFILPFYIGEVIVTRTFSISFRVIPIILFLGIFPSLLSYFWWNNGVAKVGAGTSAMFFYLLPVFAAIMAFLFLGEDIRLFHIIGAILIFLGLYLSINKQKNR